MKDQIKQAFKAGWLANHQGKDMPDSYIDRIVNNAFKNWRESIEKPKTLKKCTTCGSGLISYPEIDRVTCSCGRMVYNVKQSLSKLTEKGDKHLGNDISFPTSITNARELGYDI